MCGEEEAYINIKYIVCICGSRLLWKIHSHLKKIPKKEDRYIIDYCPTTLG